MARTVLHRAWYGNNISGFISDSSEVILGTLARRTAMDMVLRQRDAWSRAFGGGERYGMVVSSHAERLKPYAIDLRYQINPVLWFLNDRDNVRSSYYLEDVASGFDVQGLELDWTLIA